MSGFYALIMYFIVFKSNPENVVANLALCRLEEAACAADAARVRWSCGSSSVAR